MQSRARASPKTKSIFRLGFEAALHARTRCMEFDQVSAAMDAALEDFQRQHPGAEVEEPLPGVTSAGASTISDSVMKRRKAA